MTTSNIEPIRRPFHVSVAVGIAAWATFAIALVASGALLGAPPPLIPALIVGITLAGVIAYRRMPSARAFVQRMDPRPAIAFHVVRIAFLRLGAAGELPEPFVRVAGPGDVIAGSLAILAVLAAADLASPARRWAVLGWNLIALADIVAVIITAQRLILIARDLRMVRVMGHFPFGTLPTFVVPLVLLTHLAVFVRLRAASREAQA